MSCNFFVAIYNSWNHHWKYKKKKTLEKKLAFSKVLLDTNNFTFYNFKIEINVQLLFNIYYIDIFKCTYVLIYKKEKKYKGTNLVDLSAYK